jgi:transposase-like protein
VGVPPLGEIAAHFTEVYGASISKDTVSRITDKVIEDMTTWSSRPLQHVYAAIFIDAIYVKVRDGQVGNQPLYAAIGVDLAGQRDVLGLWAGTSGAGESAKFWLAVLTDLKQPRSQGRVLPRLPTGRSGRCSGQGCHPPPRHVPDASKRLEHEQ